MNPLAWSGNDFLGFYTLLLTGVMLASVPLYEGLRLPKGPPAPEHLDLEPYQVALLISRKVTLVAAVVQLVHSGALRLEDGLLQGAEPLASNAHPLEKAFHAAVLQGVRDRRGLLRAAEPELARMEDALRQRGLLMASNPLQRPDTLGHLPLCAVAGLGFVKTGRELLRGRPGDFLLLLLGMSVLFAVVFWVNSHYRRSRRGDEVLQAFRTQEARHASVSPEGVPSSPRPGNLVLTVLFLGAPALPQDKELQGYLAREYTQPGDA
ncbi:TIGR04222 domain-containing membrane protein [Archangium sp.]|uniref:TIGR04222 domain-containing membrane protein n=1 Tax=Archangium sp. TaxID=1872627 RepID=UPI002D617E3F|nr:TIGR04222 domain-containing membrane protein [Archangium sp.]HYO56294.1 TIGR04222 domain-containing membrane protein [Archangium sp.]